ncbi:hypothetical protein B0H13DRAFT_2286894 [Mycena leptocephala]|nr:hypothetical protein B0H13DRAFT_2286894 [Mycena leptocephala]
MNAQSPNLLVVSLWSLRTTAKARPSQGFPLEPPLLVSPEERPHPREAVDLEIHSRYPRVSSAARIPSAHFAISLPPIVHPLTHGPTGSLRSSKPNDAALSADECTATRGTARRAPAHVDPAYIDVQPLVRIGRRALAPRARQARTRTPVLPAHAWNTHTASLQARTHIHHGHRDAQSTNPGAAQPSPAPRVWKEDTMEETKGNAPQVPHEVLAIAPPLAAGSDGDWRARVRGGLDGSGDDGEDQASPKVEVELLCERGKRKVLAPAAGCHTTGTAAAAMTRALRTASTFPREQGRPCEGHSVPAAYGRGKFVPPHTTTSHECAGWETHLPTPHDDGGKQRHRTTGYAVTIAGSVGRPVPHPRSADLQRHGYERRGAIKTHAAPPESPPSNNPFRRRVSKGDESRRERGKNGQAGSPREWGLQSGEKRIEKNCTIRFWGRVKDENDPKWKCSGLFSHNGDLFGLRHRVATVIRKKCRRILSPAASRRQAPLSEAGRPTRPSSIRWTTRVTRHDSELCGSPWTLFEEIGISRCRLE